MKTTAEVRRDMLAMDIATAATTGQSIDELRKQFDETQQQVLLENEARAEARRD